MNTTPNATKSVTLSYIADDQIGAHCLLPTATPARDEEGARA